MKRIEGVRAGALACIVALTLAPGVAAASDDGMASEAGIGALSALSTLVYGPAKILYATCGLLFGGIAWGLSGGDSDVLTAVVSPAVRGDYVVTPAHLRMERNLEFFGQDPAYRQQTSASQTAMRKPDPKIVEDDF